MKVFDKILLVAVTSLCLSAGNAFAGGSGPDIDWSNYVSVNHIHRNGCHESSETQPSHSVPEMNVAGAGIALGLVAGLVAIRREKKKPK